MEVVFGLFAALLALVAMRVLGTAAFDPLAYLVGIVSAGVLGVATVRVLRAAQTMPRLRQASWLLVPMAGSVVGMIVQTVILLDRPVGPPVLLSSGLTTEDPLCWVLCGIPMGAIPALFAAGVLAAAMRVVAPTGTHDARERMTTPFAGACALLAAGALAGAGTVEVPALVVVLLLAVIALVQVILSDRTRMRFLHRVFAGDDAGYQVVALEDCPGAGDLPAAVGAVHPRAAIMKIRENAAYRGASREPYASTAATPYEAVLPLVRRRLVLVGLLATTGAVAAIAVVMRTAGVFTGVIY